METIRKITLSGLYPIELKIAEAAGSDRYILKGDVDGLGPPEVEVHIADGYYQGKKVLTRELEFKVGLNPEWSLGERPSNLRSELYGLLTSNNEQDHVMVTLHGLTSNYYTKAWVKRLVPVPFAADPEVLVTLACEKPYLLGDPIIYDLEEIEVPGEPFVFVIDNIGDAPTGWQLTLRNSLPGPTFDFGPERWPNLDERMETATTIPSNAQVRFDSDWDTRSMTLIRSGVPDVDISGTLTASSTWMSLRPGLNYFRSAGSASAISYTPKYWGI